MSEQQIIMLCAITAVFLLIYCVYCLEKIRVSVSTLEAIERKKIFGD